MGDKPTAIPLRMFLLILTMGLFMISILVYTFYTGYRMNKVYAPLIDAAMEIKLEATLAHLWFEEIMSGDHPTDMKEVWEHQDQAAWYAKAMLEGGRNQEGVFIALDDAEMRGKIKIVQETLAAFRELTKKRIETKDISVSSTDIDRRHDNLFLNLLNYADEVETMLQQAMAKDMLRFRYTQVALIIVFVLLFLFIGITFWFFDRQRVKHFQSLHKANENLKIEIFERKQVEDALRGSEEKYRTVFESSSDAIMLLDDRGFIDCNDQALKMFGLTNKEELIGTHPSELSPPNQPDGEDSLTAANNRIAATFKDGYNKFEWVHRRKTGEEFTADVLLTSLELHGEQILHSVVRDISKMTAYRHELEGMVEERTAELNKTIAEAERNRAELLESERQLGIRNRIGDIFLIRSETDMYSDILDIILEIMASKYGFFGYINEDGDMVAPSMTKDIMDKCQIPDKDIIFPRRDWVAMWGKTLLEKKTLFANKGLHLPKGHVALARAVIVPILYQEELIGILAVADKETDYDEKDIQLLETISAYIAPILHARLQRDIEERARRKAEKKLQASLSDTEQARERVNGILKAVADGLIVTDIYNRIVLMNRAAENLLGVRLSEVLDRPIDFAIKEKTLRDKVIESLTEKTTGYKFDFEMQSDDPEHPRIMRARTSVILDPEQRETGIVTIIHDVTLEREVDRMKTEFISTAAHELRTPLTSIQGFSEILLMRENLKPEEKKKFLTYINKQAVALAGIVNDLLDISRIESGRGFTLEKVLCNAGDAIKNSLLYFQEQYSNHTFEAILPEKPVSLFVDKEKMEQVLKNLLSNAVKYSPEGGLIRVIGKVSADHYLVSIEDQGLGMTPEQVDKIFDKFYRADASSTAIEGTGLGMTIVMHIVEAHGGKVWVESELGKGTTVRFTIPI